MYIPSAFAETDLEKLHDFIEQHSFGLLVSHHERLPFATHLPFLLDRSSGPSGTLIGHIARANPQWRELAGQTALAIFSGPHTYISPSWYEAENVVPTWNYVAVHVYGRVQLVEEEVPLLDILRRTVDVYEKSMPRPWSFDVSSTFVKRLVTQIVGLRIEIEKIEGKFKLSQNHPLERRQRVVQALDRSPNGNVVAIAALMTKTLRAVEAARCSGTPS
jgi:transcriptional regulator